MNLRILESARRDIRNGYNFYKDKQSGLGNYFRSVIYSEIESLRYYAGIHSKQHGYYRLLSKKFPYGIYYEKSEKEVTVYAILDLRRNPNYIENRLKELE